MKDTRGEAQSFLSSPVTLFINVFLVGGWLVLSAIYIAAMPASVRPKFQHVLPALVGQALLLELGLAIGAGAVMLLARALDRRPHSGLERVGLVIAGCALLVMGGVFLLITLFMTFPQY